MKMKHYGDKWEVEIDIITTVRSYNVSGLYTEIVVDDESGSIEYNSIPSSLNAEQARAIGAMFLEAADLLSGEES